MQQIGLNGLIVGAIVAITQVLAWGTAGALSIQHPAILPLCWLAYALGMRHGLDADHIAAIDNVSRDLVGRGIRATGLGLYFALGHSSIVGLMSMVTAGAAQRFTHLFVHLRDWIAVYSTLVSAALLMLVVPRNILAACRSYRNFRFGIQQGRSIEGHSGAPKWLMRRVSRLQLKPWHMLFVGALFGLGFETASALAMLTMTGVQATIGASWKYLVVFPLLFAAGMTLIDSADAMLVCLAYGWAVRKPKEREIYNMVVTAFSAAAALLVGVVELATLSRTPERFPLVTLLENHFDTVGASIAVVLAVIWIAAVLHQRH